MGVLGIEAALSTASWLFCIANPPRRQRLRVTMSAMRRHAFDSEASRTTLRGKRQDLVVGDGSGARRWRGRIGYWLLLLLATALFVFLFETLTGSRTVALLAVGVMAGYMLIGARMTLNAMGKDAGRGSLG
jgi:hypothetical protein